MACADHTCLICYPNGGGQAFPFDEQLRLVGQGGEPACYLPYVISLGDGTKLSGTTNGEGCTERFGTMQPTTVMAITLSPPSSVQACMCCNTSDSHMAVERCYVKSETKMIATTNDTCVGESVVDVVIPEGEKRTLTTGEINMARSVFGRGIDYSKVWVHHGGWWLFMGMQDKNTAVTPNGEMYYPKNLYQHNFASSSIDPGWRALFIHEMAHVWQYQMGYPVKWKGLTVTSRGPSAYVYRLKPDSRLADFNMEQQGNIMSDYYMICVFGNSDMAFNPGGDADLLRSVMEPFIENPLDKSHLPG